MRAMAIAAMLASASAAVAADGDAAMAPDGTEIDPARTTELRPLPPIRSPDGGIAAPAEHPASEGRDAPVSGAQGGPGDWQEAVWGHLLEGWIRSAPNGDARALVLWLAFPVATSPAWAPYVAIERHSYRAKFNAVPYQGTDPGPLFLVGDEHREGWPVMGRVGAEIGRAVDEHDWIWARAQALVDTTWRVGATASLSWFDHAPPPEDGRRTVVGTGDVLYRIAQNPWVQFRAGVGAVALIDDDIGARGAGPDLAYVIDAFPEQPLVLSTTLDVGWVHGQRIAGADFSAGLVIPHTGLEVFGGWRWQHLDHDGVQGVAGGVRWWF